MKNTIKLLAVFLLFGFLVACSENEAKRTVQSCLDAYKSGDILLAETYMSGIEDENLMGLRKMDLELFSKAFKYLEYEIGDSSVSGDKANIQAKIKVKDMPKANGMLIDEIFRLSMNESKSGWDIEAELPKLYDEFLEKVGFLERELDIELVKKDDKWTIVPDYDFKNNITGGLYSSVGIDSETDELEK